MNHVAAAAIALTPEVLASEARVAGDNGLRCRRVQGVDIRRNGIDLLCRQGSEGRHASGGNTSLDEIAQLIDRAPTHIRVPG